MQASTSNLILASQSPRRRALLSEAGYRFEVIPSSVDESTFDDRQTEPADYAQRLALAKARDVARRYPTRMVLGADTIVDCHGRIIGKPRDALHAERITRLVFSCVHSVITGLALVCQAEDLEIVAMDRTWVYPKPMTEDGIAAHIQGGSWQGKAGAYAIQETGDQFVDHIEGSLSNVIGLPLELLARLLAQCNGQRPEEGI